MGSGCSNCPTSSHLLGNLGFAQQSGPDVGQSSRIDWSRRQDWSTRPLNYKPFAFSSTLWAVENPICLTLPRNVKQFGADVDQFLLQHDTISFVELLLGFPSKYQVELQECLLEIQKANGKSHLLDFTKECQAIWRRCKPISAPGLHYSVESLLGFPSNISSNCRNAFLVIFHRIAESQAIFRVPEVRELVYIV